MNDEVGTRVKEELSRIVGEAVRGYSPGRYMPTLRIVRGEDTNGLILVEATFIRGRTRRFRIRIQEIRE